MRLLLALLLGVTACYGQRYQLVPFPWGSATGNHLVPDAIAYWQMDEASGDLVDASGNGRTMVEVNTPGSGTGVVAGSRTFDNSNPDYFTNAFNGIFGFTNSAFTITCWGQFDQAPPHVDDMSLLTRGDWGSATNFSWGLLFDNGGGMDAINFFWSTNGTFDAGNVISFPLGGDADIQYYFICLRWDGANFHLSATYQTDGSVAADVTAAFSGTLFNLLNPVLFVGILQGSSLHNMRGQIDEMGVWGRYISDCERDKLYTARAGAFTWPLFDSNTCAP